jgi:ATP-binding cassette subfamily C (CFTR/MRP) protein 1
MDDVSSGLDAHTENAVFHNLLGRDGILRRLNTTVIMASSRSKRLSYADHIICLGADGRISEQGSFDKLNSTGGYVSLLHVPAPDWTYERTTPVATDGAGEPSHPAAPLPVAPAAAAAAAAPTSPAIIAPAAAVAAAATTATAITASAEGDASVEAAKIEASAVSKEEPGNVNADESVDDKIGRRTGDTAVYTYYIRAIGWIPTLLFVTAIGCFIFCQAFPSIWINWWADANEDHPNERLGYWLGIYAMLGGLALIFLLAGCWQMIVTMVPLSGNAFHWSLLRTVLDAPMSFFAVTDSGITINRFSQDLQLIDMDLPITALNTFATFVMCIAQMILVAVGSYYTAIAFPFLIASLWLVQRVYLRTSRQLRFMDLEAKSPLYAQFTETLLGLATLRAFGWRGALEEKHHELLDRSQRPYYLLYSVQRWLTFVLDMFVASIAVLLLIIVSQLRGVLKSGMIGVALVNVILFSQYLKLLMMFWTNLETHIGAISRIKAFTSHTESEHLPEEKEEAPEAWPSRGSIAFENVSAGYKRSENVLKNLTLSIEAGQKIGICGRTGSGKSSLVSCLFRMIYLNGGRIIIDGVDISTLPREVVRTRLVGVPQDAFLVAGSSVRFNADPAGGLSDAAVEDALRAVELWDIVSEKGLDAPVEDLHLSHGQQQLFCFARAMLRPSPILVLDEATSSVDAHTDALIQRVMRERFSGHTVLAIVHKLESALDDYDAVALLDGGELREFGSPRELLARGPEASAFAALYASLASGNKNKDDNGEGSGSSSVGRESTDTVTASVE